MLLFWVDLLYCYLPVILCLMATFAAQSCDAVSRFKLISKNKQKNLDSESSMPVHFDRSVTPPQEMPP